MLGAFPPQAQGIQEYCREVAETLAVAVDVHAIGFHRMYPAVVFPGVKTAMDPAKPPLQAAGLDVEHRLTWYNPTGWALRATRVSCDIFHLQWWSLPLFPVSMVFLYAMRKRRKPIVVTVHNVLPHEGSRNFLCASRLICRHADRVVIHSETNRHQLIEHYGLAAERVAQIPMGFAGAALPAPPRDQARAALGLNRDRRYLLSFGTIRPYKGIMDLIDAFASVAPVYPDADLIVAGKPWEDWTPYAERVQALGLSERIHTYLGYQPEDRVPLFYGATDLLVLPYTHFDAQSAVGAQALAYDVPILVSDVGGLPDWVDHDTNWIVQPGDCLSLASALARFLDDPIGHHDAFRDIAGRVRARLSRPTIAQAYANLYQEIQEQPLTKPHRGHERWE